MNRILSTLLLGLACFAAPLLSQAAEQKPNILLINMDNFGYGELGVYGGGITRGAPTPRIDQLAAEGIRLTNFNVEAQCTPSRAALMTGRYAIRSGNPEVPIWANVYGLTQWEVTMPEMLGAAGYSTAAFGKWHLGRTKGRFPTDMGFDEWYGIPNSTDESNWPDNAMFRDDSHPEVKLTHVMQSRKGEEPQELKVFDHQQRRLIDNELTEYTIDFMQRQVKAGKPFFAYVPYTMVHYPLLPHPDFDGKSKNGVWGDLLMQIDSYTGRLLDEVDKLGIADNTIVIFTSDNGPDMVEPWVGSAGPWRGTYFTGLEGSLRVPFIMRWPGKVPAGRVSNEIVHEMDLFTTFATISGGKVPTDRAIDGVDQTAFFTGKQEQSNRDSVVIYVGKELFGVKWRDWKMMSKEMDTGTSPIKQYSIPHIYNLLLDPREERPMTNALENFWVVHPLANVLLEHMTSLKKYPPIAPGTPDPYSPPTAQ